MQQLDMINFFGKWREVVDLSVLEGILNTLSAMDNYCPEPQKVFRAFTECDYDKLKIVFLGMDPYPQKGVATGLAFANSIGTKPEDYSPSLRVILDSVKKHYLDIPNGRLKCDLLSWSSQGVLLLNSALTVKEDNPGSHMQLWRPFTSSLLWNISQKKPNTIFVFFGNQAKSFRTFINKSPYLSVMHPSFCARNNCLLPDIFTKIDEIMIGQDDTQQLIYWL